LTLFDPLTKQVNHYSFPYHIGKGVGIREHQLYVSLNNGIGAIDLENWQVTNSSLVSDPGSSSFVYFADIVLDTLNSQLFATTTDYFSMGQGFIFDLNGIQIGSFVAGISAEALALDYRTISSFAEILSNHVEVFPNPATSKIIITSNLKGFFETIKIYNAHGQLVKILERSLSPKFEIEVSDLFPGIYVIVVATERSEVAVSNFIKQ